MSELENDDDTPTEGMAVLNDIEDALEDIISDMSDMNEPDITDLNNLKDMLQEVVSKVDNAIADLEKKAEDSNG